MSRVGDMVRNLCPDGVEFQQLGNLCTIFNGFAFKSEYFNTNANGLPIIRIRDVNTGFSDTYFSGEFDDRWVVEDGDYLIGMDGDFRINRWSHGRALLNQRVCRLQDFSTKLLPGFAFYVVQDELDRIHASITSSTVKHLSSRELERSRIPVPPLEVQREIAQLLDRFTQQTAELEIELRAETQARRRQYEHYRNVILTPVDGTSWSTLGGVSVKVMSGGTPSSGHTDYYGGDIPWLRTQEVDYSDITSTSMTITEAGLKNSSAKWIPANCVIVAMYGATAAKAAINTIPLTTNQACCNLQIDPSVADFRYIFYWVSNEYERLKAKGEGSQSNLNAKKVKDYPIPVPPLERQREIVAAIQSLDDLTSSLRLEIPAELNARRRQYRYYRDRLLTFQEAST